MPKNNYSIKEVYVTIGEDNAVLRKAVDVVLAYQMPYIEIYQADILDPELQDTIAYAHTHLYKENFK